MLGGMQDFELRVSSLLDHAAREHGTREIVSLYADGSVVRGNWAQLAHDARRVAQALQRLGINTGDRVATLGMNHGKHMAVWYGAMGVGAIIHTINPRLFEEQLAYIANHAEDRVLFYDEAFAPLVEKMKPQWPLIQHYISLDGSGPDSFDAMIAQEDGDFAWVTGDERDPCMLCYTSGTTGNPKGVLYSHRSTVIHALAEIQPACMDMSPKSVLLPIVPMFHVCAWGIPFGAAIAGSKLVFSAMNDGASLCRMMREERVTHSAGVPTVWLGMFAHMDATGEDLPSLRHVVVGGSAAPRAMLNRLMDMGIEVNHLWGMTELSPVGTISRRGADYDDMTRSEKLDLLSRQGGPPFGVEMRIVNDAGISQPRDGKSSGRLQVRGPWVVERYFQDESGPAVDAESWFDTGDVAVIHHDNVMQITDRSKDVIKSGGEWISSVELENEAIGCAGVAEAAAIGVYHPKWDERPVLIVVRKPGADVTEDAIRTHLASRIAKWWLPDRIIFTDSLPHTGTGKILKSALRDQYGHIELTDA